MSALNPTSPIASNRDQIARVEAHSSNPISKIANASFEKIYAIYNFIYSKNPVTEKREFWFIPAWYEEYLGRGFYYSLMKSQGGDTLNDNWRKTVDRVGKRLESHAARQDVFDYRFNVVRSPVENAWCLPGGKIAIYEGLLRAIYENKSIKGYEDVSSEDKIAAVLAHEIGHADIRHSARKIERILLMNLVLLLLQTWISITTIFLPEDEMTPKLSRDDADWITQLLGNLFIKLYFFASSRSDELEADKYSITKYMKGAGYNPRASLWLMEYFKTKEIKFPAGIKWLYDHVVATHPSADTRLQANRKTIEEMSPVERKTNRFFNFSFFGG